MFDFKGLINALLRKKNDDPVGDLKSATIWVQELPQADIHRALQEILKALARVQKNTTSPLGERMRVLLYLDEKARSLQNSLCRECLPCLGNPDQDIRHKLPTLLHFWDAMSDTYYDLVRQYSRNPSGKLKKQIPLITAKAMHYLAMQAKWHYFRYLPVETYIWRRMARLYRFAESERFKDKLLKLYPDLAETTCAREYMQAMLLHLANPSSLQPEQIEMVDFWLDSWAASVEIENTFRPHRQLYAISLEDAKPPRKLRRNMVDNKYRYWSVGLLTVHINQVIAQLKDGVFPAKLKLGEDCRLPECLDFIEEITKRWSGESSTRRHERTEGDKPLVAVEGLQNIIARIQKDKKAALPAMSQGAALYAAVYLQPDDAASKKEQAALPSTGEPDLFEPATLKMTQHNESLGGLGVSLAANGEDKLRLGSLVGLKKQGGKHYAIGVIRRISKEPSKQVNIGIQLWTPTPVVVNLFPLEKDDNTHKSLQALYLPEYPELQMGRSLVLPVELYAPGKHVTIMAQGKSYLVSLQQAAAKNRDYVRAGFDLVKRSRAPA